jgi:predicted nucleic acid-binding protein
VNRVYLDASAIVKLVAEAPESTALVAYLAAAEEACTSAFSEVEVTRALRRLGLSAAEASPAFESLHVVAIDAAIRARASALLPLNLRSADAIHLATALELGATAVQLVTYDARLAAAGRAHGFTVVQPG